MAEKEQNLQPELFTQGQESGQYKPKIFKNPFSLRIRNYEKVMLLIMGLILISIIFFSIGVEKGKQIALLKSKSEFQYDYTIQIAAFKNKQLALAQAQALAKKGLNPLLFAKGNIFILCVGKFSNQESAQPLLIQLQKTYVGCRIRRL